MATGTLPRVTSQFYDTLHQAEQAARTLRNNMWHDVSITDTQVNNGMRFHVTGAKTPPR